MSKRTASAAGTLLPIAARIGGKRVMAVTAEKTTISSEKKPADSRPRDLDANKLTSVLSLFLHQWRPGRGGPPRSITCMSLSEDQPQFYAELDESDVAVPARHW